MERKFFKLIVPVLVLALASCGGKTDKVATDSRTISTAVLKDKIAGGWAGKMIGVTYGAPTEFRLRVKHTKNRSNGFLQM